MKWFCVTKDSAEAAAPPDALKAVVAPGYVICVFPRAGEVRGLIHLGPSTMEGSSAADAVTQQVEALNRRFEVLGARITGATAEVIGGADVTRVLAEHRRQQHIARNVELIKQTLARWKIEVTRTRIGGTKGRVVEMRLPCKSAEVSFASKDRRPSQHRRDFLVTPADPIVVRRHDEQTVNMGCIRVARPPSRFVAVLGSCVGVALYDQRLRVGALAHIMMPSAERLNGSPGKFADTAIPELIRRLEAEGSQVPHLRAKLAGGANVLFRGSGTLTQLGMRNVEATRQALKARGIPVTWEDVGGRIGRKILVELEEFRFVVKLLDLREVHQ